MRKAWYWLEERLELSKLAWLGTRIVPRGVGWWYTFGASTLIVFVILVITGAFLMFNYDPSPDHAYASVQFIGNSVAFGSLIQSIHHWAAYAIVALVGIHALQVFFFASYRYPRETTWLIGVVLLLLVGGMAFTGYLLPWDQRSYWATVVGSNIAQETPWIGGWLKTLLVGGSQPGAPMGLATPTITLTRFFALHVAVLPALIVTLISTHIFLVVRLGISQPPGTTALACDTPSTQKSRKEIYEEHYQLSKQGGVPFVPNTITYDTVVAVIVVAAVFILAALFPFGLLAPANPIGTAFSPKPEWYFIWVQTALRLFPGKLEPIGAIIIPLIGVIVILSLPFFNRGLNRTFSARKGLVGVGVFAVAFVLVLEVYGFLFPPTLAVPSAPTPPPGANYGQVAALGKPAYDNSCASCHGANGQGVVAPALWGSKAALGKYNTAKGLFDFISSQMPVGAPGTLPHTTYLDIMGYLMVQNGYVPNSQTFSENQFSSIALKAHATSAPPTATLPPTATATPAPTPTTAPAGTFGQLAGAGQSIYDTKCASCHGTQGQGVNAPALWGSNANLTSLGTANGLLDYISANMPPGAAGTLSHQDYLDVLGYLLIQGNDVSSVGAFSESALGGITLK